MEPTLVIMAAGLGSRFGGLKQMTPVDAAGQVILDYSAYDALQAGFRRIVCVLKKEMEEEFHARIGRGIGQHCSLHYAFQDLADLPDGYDVPSGREKPWGTAHAVRAARKYLDGPFAVINADDFYGRGAFQALYDFLSQSREDRTHCLIAYRLRNTLTENGTVARGICTVSPAGQLLSVTEHTSIQGPPDAPSYQDETDGTRHPLDPDAPVSLNTWGFQPCFLESIEAGLTEFLRKDMPKDPAKAEFFLPGVVNACLAAGTDRVMVLPTVETWRGVTYHADLPALQAALEQMRQDRLYPQRMWD